MAREHCFNRGTARREVVATMDCILSFHDTYERRVRSCVLRVEMGNVAQANEFLAAIKAGKDMTVTAESIFTVEP